MDQHKRLIRLFAFAFRENDAESLRVAVQAARAAAVLPVELSSAILAEVPLSWKGYSWSGKRLGSEALAAAGRFGELQMLERFIAEGDWETRADVASALGSIGGSVAREALARASEDPDNWVRVCANRALKLLPERYASEEPGELNERGRAITALILGDAEQADLRQVATLWEHRGKALRESARDAIRKSGAAGCDALFEALSECSPVVSLEAVQFLGELGDRRAAPHLIRTAALGEPKAQEESLRLLHKVSSPDDPDVVAGVAALYVAAAESDQGRLTHILPALRSLLRLAGGAATPHLLRAFSTNPAVRRREGAFIGGSARGDAVPLLVAAFQDIYRTVRTSAAAGLAAAGEVAVPHLLAMLAGSQSDEVRRTIVEILGRIGDPRALKTLEVMIEAPRISDAAVEALAGFQDSQTLEILRRVLRNPAWRRRYLESLEYRINTRPPGPDLVPLLEHLLSFPTVAVRRGAFKLFRTIASGVSLGRRVEVLLRVLADTDTYLVRAAIDYIAGLGAEIRPAVIRARESVSGALEERLRRALDALDAAIARREEERLRNKREAGAASPAAASERLEIRSPALSPTLAVPFPLTDLVHFSVTAPLATAPGESFVLGVWVHRRGYLTEVWKYATRQQHGRDISMDSRGPVPVRSRVTLTVQLSITKFGIEGMVDTIYWSGEPEDPIGNCTFPVTVPNDASTGTHLGKATLRIDNMPVAKLDFAIEVGPSKSLLDDMTTYEARFHTAFASYAAEDRDRVLGRIQGMLKLLPELDIFVDVMSLRSGEKWAQRITDEILSKDAFLLFWSLAASKSEWVEHEWRTALRHKGLESINPVPLDPPVQAPPPPELTSLHFGEFTLGFEGPG